ncbi:MAG: heavy-metal-associated domain-containing protein [Halarcobacter sp.]
MKIFLLFVLFLSFSFADKISVLSIPKMHCPLCTTAVKKAIKSVAGVKSVSVRLNTKKATVVYEDSLALKDIIEAVDKTSYKAIEVSTKDKQ